MAGIETELTPVPLTETDKELEPTEEFKIVPVITPETEGINRTKISVVSTEPEIGLKVIDFENCWFTDKDISKWFEADTTSGLVKPVPQTLYLAGLAAKETAQFPKLPRLEFETKIEPEKALKKFIKTKRHTKNRFFNTKNIYLRNT